MQTTQVELAIAIQGFIKPVELFLMRLCVPVKSLRFLFCYFSSPASKSFSMLILGQTADF